MIVEARYKVGTEVMGPRPLADIRRDIESGLLAPQTPIQLTADGLWTTLDGAQRKLGRFRKPSAMRSSWMVFLVLNVVFAGAGYLAPWICMVIALGSYVAAGALRYFEEGQHSPGWAFARFFTMLVPFLGFYVVGGAPASPSVRWIYATAFVQFVLFWTFAYIQG